MVEDFGTGVGRGRAGGQRVGVDRDRGVNGLAEGFIGAGTCRGGLAAGILYR